MSLPVLFSAAGFVSEEGPRDVDVALETTFTVGYDTETPTATLELNAGGAFSPVSADLTREQALRLRDALDALLGESDRVRPPF